MDRFMVERLLHEAVMQEDCHRVAEEGRCS